MPIRLPKTIEGLAELVEQLRERIAELEKENKRLREEVKKLTLKEKKRQLGSGFSPKANTPKKKSKKRRKREEGFGRAGAEEPDREEYHAYSECPDCNVSISGTAVAYRREIIEIPIVKPVITWHWILKRRCWRCRKVCTPKVDFSKLTLGKARFGLNVMSLVTTLKERFRLPVEQIQSYLKTWYGLDVSAGGIISILDRVAKRGETGYEQLEEEIRRADVIHADETGWREAGQNGYVWNFNTKEVRYFVYKRSRKKQIVTEVLGEEFDGTLVSDFYSVYNGYGEYQQRCWAHLSRDLKDLTGLFPDKEDVLGFCQKLKELYEEGLKIQKQKGLSLRERHAHRRRLENEALELAMQYASKKQKDHPVHTMAKRIDKYVDELFVFVLDPQIPSTNNSAERALRHTVIARKISGGTRSEKGSQTKSILASLFGTWHTRELNPFLECRQLLANPNYSFRKSE